MSEEKERAVFLCGKKTILRPIDPERDLEKCLRWVNDQEIQKFVAGYLPMAALAEIEYLKKKASSVPTNDIMLAIETQEGVHIGNIGLHNINWKDRTATTGTMIGEKEFWGRGYGTDAKMTLLSYAFYSLNLRKICSSVLAYNERSLRYSLRCGYKQEGVLRHQRYKNGRYYDELLLAVFKKDWRPLWRRYQKTGSLK